MAIYKEESALVQGHTISAGDSGEQCHMLCRFVGFSMPSFYDLPIAIIIRCRHEMAFSYVTSMPVMPRWILPPAKLLKDLFVWRYLELPSVGISTLESDHIFRELVTLSSTLEF